MTASILYNLLLLVCSPVLFVYFLWRVFVSKESSESWRQNLGALPPLANRELGRKLVWIHAASVGETVASLPVQQEIKRLHPDAIILHTTITQTGQAVARKSCASADEIAYFPIDCLPFVNRALDRVRPDVFATVDTELWPNFLSRARKQGVATVLINGRIDRSLKGGKWLRWLMKWATSNLDLCLMQTDEDGFRIISLGARPKAISVVGSTKFDEGGGELSPAEVEALRDDLGLPEGAPVLVAGSTNPGEDEPVLDAFKVIRDRVPSAHDMRLIIAPRQLDRTDEICSFAEARGFTCARRSVKDTIRPGGHDVLILDTFGELAAVYAVGNIAFVGGSLIPKGGHSIIQPILQGKPVLFGPYTHRTRDIAQTALSAGVGFEVNDAAEFASLVETLLGSPERLSEINSACRELVDRNRGASTRCAEAIVRMLEDGHVRQ